MFGMSWDSVSDKVGPIIQWFGPWPSMMVWIAVGLSVLGLALRLFGFSRGRGGMSGGALSFAIRKPGVSNGSGRLRRDGKALPSSNESERLNEVGAQGIEEARVAYRKAHRGQDPGVADPMTSKRGPYDYESDWG